ncbi:phage major capsid protein [Methylomicrobium sp. Wu6]|uniref:phage major capsid protein n=1 Tax=Methylomicrobium sp. Wu6 TaxID=3107928 RepID=UPI002DD67459|nr:phage major capsid protein [Methylomicrobium sp. Wu6]MEC4747795.1 phage major capsid protein [Methylomicrobium sp. Wu6]
MKAFEILSIYFQRKNLMFTSYIKSHAWGLLAVLGAFIASWAGWNIGHEGIFLAGLGTVSLGDINDLLEKQGQHFEDFVKRNDQKIKSLEKDVIDILIKANRPNVGGGSRLSGELYDSKASMADFIRSRGEIKAMSSGSGPDGGWTVYPFLADGIGTIVRNNSALRSLVNFVELETGDSYEELVSASAVGASWVGETTSRPVTNTPNLKKITTPLLELYAMPTLSQRLADDSSTAMVDFLVNECGLSFAEAEEDALFNGDGVIAPKGLLSYTTAATADVSRAWGQLEHVVSGVSGDFPTETNGPLDPIKTLFYKLKAGYRSRASWVMNSATAAAISKEKDQNSQYLWNDAVAAGDPPTLMGRPVIISEAAPAIAADSKSIWFGDWATGIRAVERPGNKVLLDPFTDKPNLRVYVYKRTGWSIRDSNAIKCLKFST